METRVWDVVPGILKDYGVFAPSSLHNRTAKTLTHGDPAAQTEKRLVEDR
ncbi:MAG: hypothetical protein JOZ19_07945 [Rubrobacter sp.]|nr:hypothetical protein [Rubrobacter sp.]